MMNLQVNLVMKQCNPDTHLAPSPFASGTLSLGAANCGNEQIVVTAGAQPRPKSFAAGRLDSSSSWQLPRADSCG
jgi:hypothetical protein